MKFNSRAGQIGHSVANGSPPLRHIFNRSSVACRRNDAEVGPANSLHASAYYREYNKKFDFGLLTRRFTLTNPELSVATGAEKLKILLVEQRSVLKKTANPS